jgi:cyclase
MTIRVIPRLDVKGPNLVKGVHFEGLRVLGRPETFAQHYYEEGADELLYMDVVASLYGRNSLLPMIEQTSKVVSIPMTVGGGLRTLDDIRNVLHAGADKVALNTAAIQRPDLVRNAVRRFGASTIVVSIEAIPDGRGGYTAYTDNGREETGLDVFSWAAEAARLGAGEIMVTSIDREGTGKGYDTELTRRISELVDLPVIACGGAGSVDDVVAVVRDGHADAVSMATILHYGYLATAAQHDFSPDEGNTEFLRGLRSRSRPGVALATLKSQMIAAGIPCRPPLEGRSA